MSHRGGKSGNRKGPKGQLPREVEVSKAMSLTLRHRAASDGLKMDKNGYVNLAELLALRRFQSLAVTLPEVQKIVAENDKQRFSLVPASENTSKADGSASPPAIDMDSSDYLIRANQGHSLAISSEDLLKPVLITDADCPHQVVHGTDQPAWSAILKSGGLKKMGRQHMHFARGIPTFLKKTGQADADPQAPNIDSPDKTGERGEAAVVGDDGTTKSVSAAKSKGEPVISGMRKNASIMIWVDLARSAKDGGLKWWRSDNGVILTEGDKDGFVKMEWVDRVERRGTGEVLWQRTAKTS